MYWEHTIIQTTYIYIYIYDDKTTDCDDTCLLVDTLMQWQTVPLLQLGIKGTNTLLLRGTAVLHRSNGTLSNGKPFHYFDEAQYNHVYTYMSICITIYVYNIIYYMYITSMKHSSAPEEKCVCPCGDAWGTLLHLDICFIYIYIYIHTHITYRKREREREEEEEEERKLYSLAPVKAPRGETLRSLLCLSMSDLRLLF